MALLEIGHKGMIYGQFLVDGFFELFAADLRQPHLERLGLGRGDGLDDAKRLLRVGDVSHVIFPSDAFIFSCLLSVNNSASDKTDGSWDLIPNDLLDIGRDIYNGRPSYSQMKRYI